MNVSFDNEDIAEVAQSDNPRCHRYRNLPKNVIRNFHKAVLYFRKAKTIQEIWQIRSLRYERLSGKLKGYGSIRLNDQYRAVLTEEEDGIIITGVVFYQISNHYE